MFETFSNGTEGDSLGPCDCLILRRTICHCAGYFDDIGNPATVDFFLSFYSEY